MIHVDDQGAVKVIRMSRALLGRPLYWTAAYWVDGLLIDAGPRCTAQALTRVLHPLAVEQVVITHGHEDHIGGLAAIHAAYPEAPIYASRRTLPLLADPKRLAMQRYRRWIWGEPEPVHGALALDEASDRLQTTAYQFRVVETPGHSVDHISLFEPTLRWAFTGDAFVGGRDQAWTPEVDLFSTLGSLRTLADLRPERLFPGSGTVRRTPQPDLHAKIGYLMALAHEVARLEAKGLDVEAIGKRLFPQKPGIQRWTLGHFSVGSLIEACRAYNAIVHPLDAGAGQHTARQQLRPRWDWRSGRGDRVY